VGIGVASPTSPLHVVGNAHVTGGLIINNTVAITNDRIGRFANGTASAPAFSFSTNTNTGMFLPESNTLAFSTLGVTRILINNTGYVGIGTNNPQEKLHVIGNMRTDRMVLNNAGANNNFITNSYFPLIYASKSGGNIPGGGSSSLILQAGGGTENNRHIFLRTDDETRLFIHNSGRIGIGTISPEKMLHVVGESQFNGDMRIASANLYVNGEIHAKKIRATYTPWPDYVFDPSYNLLQLDEVEKFIQTNFHLPGIPPGSQVEKEGFELAEMNGMLLRKIEELTLYVIEQQKELNVLKDKIARIEN
jgi:hypothetical protein